MQEGRSPGLETELKGYIETLGLSKWSAAPGTARRTIDLKDKAQSKENEAKKMKGKRPVNAQKLRASTSHAGQTLRDGKSSTYMKLLIKPGKRWGEDQACTNCEARKERRDFAWMETVVKKGTMADRMAAYTMLIQDSPVHTMRHLKQLLNLVSNKARREGLMALDTLKELFLSDLLLETRKLRAFEMQPLCEAGTMAEERRERFLILCFFEDQLKEAYSSFIQAVNELARDTVEATRLKAIHILYELLLNNSEQEQTLLSSLVNKIGDPVRKVAARTMHRLLQLLSHHPQMKHVITLEVERMIFSHIYPSHNRPNVSQKAQYYAVCFLNQILLCRDDLNLAAKLVSIYFALFKASVKTGEVESKLMSGLLTGVHRAFPYLPLDGEKKKSLINEELETMYKIVHVSPFSVATQALMLIFHVLQRKGSLSDRFYMILYRKLLDPALLSSSKQNQFLNLLFKALTQDSVLPRLRAFLKRLLQLCLHFPVPLVCGFLILISTVLKQNPTIVAIKSKSFLEDGQSVSEEDGSGEEDYKDVQDSDEEEKSPETKPHSSWVHKQNLLIGRGKRTQNRYDPTCRNPLYAGAESVSFWELKSLTAHCHPTIAVFAQKICDGESINYSSDPMQDFSLSHFLDRFVFKNPKNLNREHQLPQDMIMGKRRLQQQFPAAVNMEMLLSMEEHQVPVEEKFLYRYYILCMFSCNGVEVKAIKTSIRHGKLTYNLCHELNLGLHAGTPQRLPPCFFKNQSEEQEKRNKGEKEEEDEEVESVSSDEFQEFLQHRGREHVDMEDSEGLDFANLFLDRPEKGQKHKVESMEDDDNSDTDDQDEEDNEGDDVAWEDEEENEGGIAWEDEEGWNEEEIEFSDESDSDIKKPTSSKGRRHIRQSKEDIQDDLFVSAEQLSSILESSNRGSNLTEDDWESRRFKRKASCHKSYTIGPGTSKRRKKK
ncbi:unnamed protein product [Darwinula stevensoni]|uniref:CCAAT-binding factor domain-containing protein n=1 Tax=Darwinula stevensoni TaxID=69355 RepID=A0A7R9A7U1_9CRUS|nr:unnamed protein product [Darwinula stevensoni]CAG0895017.1 unnamed protein product [Darwinula stevensoni]